MNFEGGRHCKVIRSIGVSLGLWPYGCTILGKINGAIALTIIVLCIVAQLAVFITHEYSVDLFLMAMIGIVPPTIYVVKYLFFMWNMEQVKYMFEWIQSDYDSLTTERELRLIEKFADIGTIVSKTLLYCMLLIIIPLGFPFLVLLFNIEALIIQSRSGLIPLNVEYFVDQDRYFYWIVLHLDTTTLLGIFILFVTESASIHFIIHACALLEITGDRVERVLESNILNVHCGKTYLAIHGQLVATITLHQRTLKFIENMNSSVLPHYCILFSIGVVSLSMNLYIYLPFENLNPFDMFATENPYSNLLAREMLLMKVTVEMTTTVILIIIHLFYMGCASYVAQAVLDKGRELFTKTYYARWHEAPLPVQKMWLYMRQRSMLPTALVFGGLYTGSFEFFFKLVNTSMSYFTVLYSTA